MRLLLNYIQYYLLGNDEYSEDESKILLRKGFEAAFVISENFADLSFITGSHITGTSKTYYLF
jgi:hypothetical protein